MNYQESRLWRYGAHGILLLLSMAALLPVVLMIMSSITEETSIVANGYSFVPETFSLSAYHYLWNHAAQLTRAYGVTLVVTVTGTVISVTMIAMLAYPLSRRDYPLKSLFSFMVLFTMLFNGGLVPTYLFYTQFLNVKNTIFALIVPNLLMNGFLVFIARSFYMITIPPALLEAAKIDGAGEIRTFYTIVLPLAKPVLATLGLLQAITYWNDWFNGLIYLTDPKLFTIQYLLNQMNSNIQFLASNNLGNLSSMLPGESVRMAIAVIGVLPLILAYPLFQNYFVKGITLGAVK
ncbi:carbohydrate ABC transporter permease [Paenibacillus piscarius]|uniref:carbohydrate ABC transporter permease n=1 Tax=Paenibacillus piscarius TaxID=1089681 RepID=UPI001EE8E8F5|nr:carbohydrate ABC transporter permease [Paenibacillus piscarius]